ncbi:YigZ family protein [Peptoniphilus stercorisuis]|uniref:YigZ family protein n=1 Tax=Peptoniphilus stercorisuis TaxID=1436965 RepID=A0ABS4KAB1_9FIRM|nr:YigZ family protein [Peptoniphilus stercorisuis]MBP2024704.1 putative YigZ family protein [Peptoniphilus stercorisuis]
MSLKYYSILKDSEDEFIERKSKFIGYAFKVESEEMALEKLNLIKEKHRDATHNCSAYIIGEDKLIQRYSDDGEPSGTAGVPILEVLKKEDLTNVLIVVTRYFGGILLGAGGLVRAYTKGAKIAIDASRRVDMVEYNYYSFKYDYTYHGAIQNFLIKNGYKIIEENYTDVVELKLHGTEEDKKLIEFLTNETSGTIKIEILSKDILPTLKGKIIY